MSAFTDASQLSITSLIEATCHIRFAVAPTYESAKLAAPTLWDEHMSQDAFRLIDSGWDSVLRDSLRADGSQLHIICPFIKLPTVERLLKHANPQTLRCITRFDLNLYAAGVSDLAALRMLMSAGAQIRGVKNVHAKLYLIGSRRAIVTSANLTDAGTFRNSEFGVAFDDEAAARECRRYFNRLWNAAADAQLTEKKLDQFEKRVEQHRTELARNEPQRQLPDEGVDIGLEAEPILPIPAMLSAAPQAFVKFWGEANRRLPLRTHVIDEIGHSGAFHACSYSRRPVIVDDGAVMFMGRMVNPPDVRIDGRAIAIRHDPERDIASAEQIDRRHFRMHFKYLIRVNAPEFIDGTLDDGISMNAMMDELGARGFRSTLENSELGEGNVDPRKAYRQQPQVELSAEGYHWINSRLEAAFARYGKIAAQRIEAMEQGPLPELPWGMK